MLLRCALAVGLFVTACLAQELPTQIPNGTFAPTTNTTSTDEPSPAFPFEHTRIETTATEQPSPTFTFAATTETTSPDTTSPDGTSDPDNSSPPGTTPGPLPPGANPDGRPITYWITYSKTVRPGHPMVFQVRIFQGSLPVEMNIVLKDSSGNEVLRHGPVSVQPILPRTIEVQIPHDIKKPSDDKYYYYQSYSVEVTGRSDEITIKEKGRASYQEKAFSIFVQTDKAMYKPSQKVQFRTLAMTPDMKVMRDAKQDIVVYDAKGNRILQYKGVEASQNLGVVQKSFNLANSVPIGNWKIKVTIGGVEEEKEFEVADYVLPRFEVEVDGPDYGLNSDIFYDFTVRAKYTFGKPVTKGTASIEINFSQHNYMKKNTALKKRGTLNSDGEVKVQLTLRELLQLANDNLSYKSKEMVQWWSFVIDANVTETRTGRTHSGSHEIKFYPTPIQMEFLGITPNAFKSGLDFTAYIEVKKQDGSLFSALEAKKMSVMFNVTYQIPKPKTTTTTTTTTPDPNNLKPERLIAIGEDYYDRHYYPRTIEKHLELDQHTYKLPSTGWVVVTFRVPDEATSLTVKATTQSPYEEVSRDKYASKSHSPTESFLQLSVINKKPRVGDTIQVQAKATDQMKILNYQVFSKGLLVHSNDEMGPSSNLNFQFEATIDMSPSMSLVAFYLRDDGEFVVDALSLSVEGLFDNAVSVEFSKEKVQPGEQVDVIVKGEKDSVVFLLAVDKSVKLLKSGNDITQDMVREELSSYDHGNYGNWRYMFICGWPSYFGGEDASSVFENAGIVVLTDGLVYNRYNDNSTGPPVFYTMRRGMPTGAVADASPEAMGGASSMKPATRVRKLFPENWLWEAKLIDSGGQVVIPLTAPDTITSWVASVFSANPNTGLSVAAEPAEVITFRNMFISLDLPSSIVRNEDFCFPASVFSYYPGEIPVMLTLERSSDFSVIWIKEENGEIKQSSNNMYYSFFMGFMKENQVMTVTFCFKPTKIGSIPIRANATTDVEGLSDSVERKLTVKAEGFPRVTTMSYMVTPTNGEWEVKVPIQDAPNTVLGSQRISVNIAGNLLGPIFDNLEDLLQKPYGCGEQNMINFSPIMSLLDFFFTTNTITDEFKQKAIDYMLIGYQKEIMYEHGITGGYSTFGNSDTKEPASMWLTAFVTKCFSQAEVLDMKYGGIVAIDTDLILRSAKWMLQRGNQNSEGEFIESGRVFNKQLQGGSAKGIALTSYTAIALHHALKVFEENTDKDIMKIRRGLSKAVQYLENNYYDLTDPYDICITAYALNLLDSPAKNASFALMENIAKRGFGMTYWERPSQEDRTTYYWSRNSDAINIEMTSYALLTYSLRGIGTTDGLPILRWLSKQKGPNGGFISTQDTVVGIEALTSVAKNLYGAEFVPMTVTVSTSTTQGVTQSTDFQITKDNEMILQRKDIPYESGAEILLQAQTPGNMDASKSTVLADVVFNYNVEKETQAYTYDMAHSIITHLDGFDFEVKIWTTDRSEASMSILEVEIPAGFSPDHEEIKKINSASVSKTDTKGDLLNVYIQTNVIDGEGIKLRLPMIHSGGTLTKAVGKSYKIYSYYEPENELTKQYFLADEGNFCTKVPEMTICQYL